MQDYSAAKNHIQGDLNEGEEILWVGSPTGIKLVDMPYGTSIIIRWIVCLIFAAVGLWYGLIYAPSAENLSVNANAVMLVCIAIAAFVALWPLADVSKLNKKCFYYITNQRALTLVLGSSNNLKERLLKDVPEITFDMIADDRGNIYIGTKLKNSFSKARISVLTPQLGADGDDRPLIFHSVVNPKEILDIFPAVNSGS